LLTSPPLPVLSHEHIRVSEAGIVPENKGKMYIYIVVAKVDRKA